MVFGTLIVLFIVALIVWTYLDNFHSNRPPGPFRLPLLGTVLQLGVDKSVPVYETFRIFSKKYGPICSIQLGIYSAVIFDDFDTIKKLLNHEVWVDRLFNSMFAERSFGKSLGIIFINGDNWKEMRRFTIKTLRDFGYGKQKSMESVLEDEVKDLLTKFDKIRKENNSMVDMKQLFTIPVLNVLWSMVCGTRSAEDDKRLAELLILVDKLSRATPIGGGLLIPFPFLRHIFPESTGHNYVNSINKEFQVYFREVLERRRAEGTYKDEQRDYIDVFLNEIDNHKKLGSNPNYYTDEQFIITTLDLFEAGAETTSNTLEFAIYYIMLSPSVQIKIQQEIDRVVGRNRLPTIADKLEMPYTEATMHEVQRMANVLPMTARNNTEDFQLDGYTMKKGTVGFMNIFSVHMDEKFWEDPENFRPERFLDSDGKIIPSKAQRVIPFGAGRRVCLGEVLARATFFTYLTTLLQTYKLEKPDGFTVGKSYELGFTLTPAPYSVKATKRS